MAMRGNVGVRKLASDDGFNADDLPEMHCMTRTDIINNLGQGRTPARRNNIQLLSKYKNERNEGLASPANTQT